MSEIPEDVRELAVKTVKERFNLRKIIDPEAYAAIIEDAIMEDRRARATDAPTHRHKKRGSEYVLIGYGKMQATDWVVHEHHKDAHGYVPVDMREVAIYRSVADGSLWARPREEFEDGRFEALAAAPVPPATAKDAEKVRLPKLPDEKYAATLDRAGFHAAALLFRAAPPATSELVEALRFLLWMKDGGKDVRDAEEPWAVIRAALAKHGGRS